LILIADAHIQPGEPGADDFFEMLGMLERTTDPVIFLGDIFDLWIVLHRYESVGHHRFLEWCEKQKQHREIGFIEGNHEFFLARNQSSHFTWCTDSPFHKDGQGNIFCHGDRINPLDRNYLLFRKLTKNPVSEQIIHRLPFGPKIAGMVKNNLKITNKRFRHYFPEKEILDFARNFSGSGPVRLFLGHFHRTWQRTTPDGVRIYAVPAWSDGGQITVADPATGDVSHNCWRELV
jgi:UDP-2,3-diacylglucosamine hydrolase